MEINNNITGQNSAPWLYFPLIPNIGKFFRLRFIEFKELIRATKYLGFLTPLVIFWIINLCVYSFIYPIVRIALGKEKSYNICNYITKTPAPPGVFSFPMLLRSKIALRKNVDWGIFIEICVRDVYHKDTLKEGMNVIDIGAHIGIYTVLAAEKIGDMGKVIAVEPGARNYERILENIRINNFNHVIVKKMALSDHNGQEKLYVSPSSVRHSLMLHGQEYTWTEVTVKTLDALLEELDAQKVNIIKIDAEGAEIPILRGSQKTLKNNPNVKIIVASYHYPDEVKEVRDFLRHMGFKTTVSSFDIVTTI